jgi:hypothetical protein
MRLTSIVTLLIGAALAAPLAAQAGHDLQLTLVQPIGFATPADCPTGAITYGLGYHGQTGAGANCILDVVPAACPAGVTADFCQNVPLRMTLTLPGGRIVADGAIFEEWTCTPDCSVVQRWSGTVTQATTRFHKLNGGAVSGGGLLVFDADFNIAGFDEALTIGEGGA